MTPQELAALPKGTRVRFLIDTYPCVSFEFGIVVQSGVVCNILWDPAPYGGDDGLTNIIDTKSKYWERFIADISLDTGSETR